MHDASACCTRLLLHHKGDHTGEGLHRMGLNLTGLNTSCWHGHSMRQTNSSIINNVQHRMPSMYITVLLYLAAACVHLLHKRTTTQPGGITVCIHSQEHVIRLPPLMHDSRRDTALTVH